MINIIINTKKNSGWQISSNFQNEVQPSLSKGGDIHGHTTIVRN